MPKDPKAADDARRQWTGGGSSPKPGLHYKQPVTIEEKLRALFADELCEEEDNIGLNADLTKHLGADSLDIVELAVRVEEEYAIEIDEYALEKLHTFGDWVRMIEKSTAAKTVTPTPPVL